MVARVPNKYEQAVRELARSHARELGNGVTIYALLDETGRDVQLLEVTSRTAPLGWVMVVPFAASKEFPFRTRIAQITPDEWKRVRSGEMSLPEGWEVDRLQRVWPAK